MAIRTVRGILLVTLLTTIVACGSDPGFNEAVDFAPKEGRVQFVTMIPESPQVTILHGLERSTGTFPVAEPSEVRFQDRYDWRIGYVDSDDQEIIFVEDENQQISEDVLSVFFVMGSLTSPDVQIVDIPLIPAADQADGTVRLTLASNLTGTSMVDVYLTAEDALLENEAPLLTLTSATVSSVIETTSGTQRLRITEAGGDTVLFDSGAIVLIEKTLELFALVDDFGPDSAAHVDVIRSRSASGSIMEDLSQSPNIRIGNYTTQGTVSLQYGLTALGVVDQQQSNEYQQTGFGAQTFTVSSTTEPVTELESRDLDARPGSLHSVYLFDDLDATEPAVRALLVPDFKRPIADRALIKFINGGNQDIDIYVLDTVAGQTQENTAPLLNDLTPVSTATTEIRTRTSQFIVTSTDGAETFDSLSLTINESSSYTILVDANSALHVVED